jgi:type IV secretory pathway VirB10-like protein
VAIIERAKCPACGADHRVDAKHCPACGARLPKPAADKDRHGSKARPAPAGLDTDALLAKIDALDWDGPLTVPGPPAATVPSPVQQRSWLKLTASAVAVLAVGLLAFYLSLSDDEGNAAGMARNPAATMAPAPADSSSATPAGSETATAAQLASVEAAERQRVAKLEQAVRQADDNARRKAERQRRAAEEEQARLEQERHEREQKALEEARLRAEREAAEARARVPVAPPAPKGPASPQELCAGESNFFTRGACEARACSQPEWQRHPYCVRRLEQQLPKFNQGG